MLRNHQLGGFEDYCGVLRYATSISGVASTGANVPDVTLTVHLPAGRLSLHVTRVSFTTLTLVACTGFAPGGPTASTCVTLAKPLPVIVKSLGVSDSAVLGLTCGLTALAGGIRVRSAVGLTVVVPK